MTQGLPISRSLAEFTVRTQWAEVPVAVRHMAARAVLNYFAVAFAGCKDPAVELAATAFRSFALGGTATVIGRGEQTNAVHAAALNAMSANVFDFDDTHMPTVLHPTSPIAPALFALAQGRPMRGQDLLLALTVGIEVACRVGLAMSPGHYRQGWHITSTCGIFGAAAATAKVLGLSCDQIVHGFGIAAAQSSGLVETLGTMAKSIGVGNSCANGLLSARLAQLGMQGPAQPLEGPFGFLKVGAPSFDPRVIVQSLGEHWALTEVAFKPYPCGVVLNPVIEACLELRPGVQEAGFRVSEVVVRGHPLLRQRTDRPRPPTGKLSQVSAQHAVAVALLRGSAGLSDFNDAAVTDPAVQALGDRLRFEDDALMPIDSATVRLLCHDGRVLERHVAKARGSLDRALTDRDLEEKLERLSAGHEVDTRQLRDAVWGLAEAPDASRPMLLAAGIATGQAKLN